MTFTPKEAIRRFRAFRQRVFPDVHRKPYGPIPRAYLKVLLWVRDNTRDDFRMNRSITRKWWGPGSRQKKGKTNIHHFVYLGELQARGGSISAPLVVKGIPGMYELGGTTKPHMIRPSKSKLKTTRKLSTSEMRFTHRRGKRTLVGEGVLALKQGSGGGVVFRRIVEKHTAKIPKKPIAGPLVRHYQDIVPDEIDEAIQLESRRMLDGR